MHGILPAQTHADSDAKSDIVVYGFHIYFHMLKLFQPVCYSSIRFKITTLFKPHFFPFIFSLSESILRSKYSCLGMQEKKTEINQPISSSSNVLTKQIAPKPHEALRMQDIIAA